MAKQKRTKLEPPTNQPWFLDLGCGVGGLSLGFFRAGFSVCGVDRSRDCVAVYRQRLGDALLSDITEVHPEARFHVVGYHASSLSDKAGWSHKPGPSVRAAVRIAQEAESSVVLILTAGALSKSSTEAMGALMRDHGFHPRSFQVELSRFLTPQRKTFRAFVGFYTKRCARLFRPPKDPAPQRPSPTVYNSLAIPFDEPSPPLTSSEYRSGRVGANGGSSSLRRASEIMAEVVGVGRWKQFTKKSWSLRPEQLAVLQGLPPDWRWGDSQKESRLVCEATPPILTQYIVGRIIVALRDGGDSLARGW